MSRRTYHLVVLTAIIAVVLLLEPSRWGPFLALVYCAAYGVAVLQERSGSRSDS